MAIQTANVASSTSTAQYQTYLTSQVPWQMKHNTYKKNHEKKPLSANIGRTMSQSIWSSSREAEFEDKRTLAIWTANKQISV